MRWTVWLVVWATVIGATLAGAQDTSAVAPNDSASCEGRRVTSIDIAERIRPSVDEVRPAFVRPLLNAVLGGTPTRRAALRPYVLLRPGGICTDARRRESERLLRDLRYVASARVHAEPDGEGVRLVVDATDELRPVVGLGIDGAVPDYLQLGSVSVAGSGVFAAAEWADGGSYRDGVGVSATTWATGGRRAIASLNLARHSLGQLALVGFGEPYLTRFQRLAWDLSLRSETQYVPLQRNVRDPTVWPTEWRTFTAAGVGRIQSGGVQLLAGGLFTYERTAPSDSAVRIGHRGLLPPSSPGLGDRYEIESGARAGVIVGMRALSFSRVEGLEALEGAHDVARGVQIAAVVGHGLSGGDNHPFAAAEAYLGAGGPTSFASARATLEQRAASLGSDTRLLSGRLAWYLLASRRQTQEVSLEFTGVWREDLPVALFLDDRRTGPRGFDGATASGSRLLVGRIERRVRAGGFSRAVGLGFAGFMDAAKLWAGDAPLGVTTIPLVSVGGGLLAAIPRNSRKTFRIDAAYPLTKVHGVGGVTVRLTITSAGRAYWREQAGFGRSRIAPTLRTLVGWF